MSTSTLLLLAITATLVALSSAGYNLVANYAGNDFFNQFDFFTGGDPTHGYVYYASEDQAKSWNLTNVNNGIVYIRADSYTVSTGSGRASVRLTSKASFSRGIIAFDVYHMPTGCGNWPALWTVGPNWPYSGEIDIVEGVNKNNKNQMTLHSGPGCTMPNGRDQTGSTISTDCNSANGANGNVGCAVQSNDDQSFGQGFNNNKGGVFAMQWEASGIYVWFWRRDSIPDNIRNNSPDPASWGKPAANFPFSSCASNHFANQQIVIDNTFCGDWAGKTFNDNGCSGSCQSFVQNNPAEFREAYWAIASIKVFE